MNIIRNGGFERGNIDFWDVVSTATLEISTSSFAYGLYCGKFTSSGEYQEFIFNKDYIDADGYNIIDISAWVKSASARDVMIYIDVYDSDYSFITHIYGISRTMDGGYQHLNSQFILPNDTAYIRCGYYIKGSNADEVFYLDSFNAHIITIESGLTGTINLHEYGRETGDGNTSNDKKDLKQFSTYYADLDIGIANGSSPTLDVSVYEIGYKNEVVLIGSFTHATGTGRERIVLTNLLGRGLYIAYTLGGSNPEFYFRVDITGKR